MSSLSQNFVKASPLVIASISVRQDEDGRYCLNDFHKAAGGQDKHAPFRFMRMAQTKELIVEINSFSDVSSSANLQIDNVSETPHSVSQKINLSSDLSLAHKVVNGGKSAGTYVCKELVYSYAMWISAKFHLHVIRAYDALVTAKEDFALKPLAPLTTKQERNPLKDAVTMLVSKAKFLSYSDAYKIVHQAMDVDSIDQIPKERLNEAVRYVHGLVGEYIPHEKPKTIEIPQNCIVVRKDYIERIIHHTSYLSEVVRILHPALRQLGSPMAGSLCGHTQEIGLYASLLKKQHGLPERITS